MAQSDIYLRTKRSSGPRFRPRSLGQTHNLVETRAQHRKSLSSLYRLVQVHLLHIRLHPSAHQRPPRLCSCVAVPYRQIRPTRLHRPNTPSSGLIHRWLFRLQGTRICHRTRPYEQVPSRLRPRCKHPSQGRARNRRNSRPWFERMSRDGGMAMRGEHGQHPRRNGTATWVCPRSTSESVVLNG